MPTACPWDTYARCYTRPLRVPPPRSPAAAPPPLANGEVGWARKCTGVATNVKLPRASGGHPSPGPRLSPDSYFSNGPFTAMSGRKRDGTGRASDPVRSFRSSAERSPATKYSRPAFAFERGHLFPKFSDIHLPDALTQQLQQPCPKRLLVAVVAGLSHPRLQMAKIHVRMAGRVPNEIVPVPPLDPALPLPARKGVRLPQNQ